MAQMRKNGEVDFVMTTDYKAPYVQMTGKPHDPQKLMSKLFRKGDLVKGEIKKDNGVIMVNGVLPIPFNVIRQVYTKKIDTSNAEGIKADATKPKIEPINNTTYIDKALIGAVVGLAATYFIEKRGWLPANQLNPYKNKLIGAGIGAALAMYWVYRQKKKKETEIKPQF